MSARRTPPSADHDGDPDVVAAGAVAVRRDGAVLLVHRPKYDDWTFPKGKQDAGEHVTVTAVREVLEETGLEVTLGRPLRPQCYTDSRGRDKLVHYWVGRVAGDDDVASYPVNDEIDQLDWFSPDEARRRLTYEDDHELLAQLDEAPVRTRALVVLRHAEAVARKRWDGPDPERPLTRFGATQARLLVPVLATYGVDRIVTSDALRCVDSVAPYAAFAGREPELQPTLAEEGWTRDAVTDVVEELLDAKTAAVVCTHRAVLPDLLDRLGIDEPPLRKGELVVAHHRKGAVVATERHLVG